MKTLRASGSRLQADVVVGRNEYGSDVTVHVTLDRKDPALAEALLPIQRLLRDRALGVLDRALHEDVIQQRVTEKLASERERIAKNAKAQAEHTAEKERRGLESQLAMLRHDNDRLRREAADHARVHLDAASTEKKG